MKEEIFGAAFNDLVYVELAFGTVAYNGHGAFEHVVELGYLVEPHFAHKAAEGGDAGVVVAREGGTAGFGVGIHGAEFVHTEGLALVTDTLLGVEDGSWTGTLDDDGGDKENGRENDQCQKGEHYVAEPLDAVLPLFHEPGVDGDEGRVEDAVDAYHAEDDVARVGGDFYDDFATAVEHAEYLLYLSVFGVFDGDNDFFDVVLCNELGYVVGGAEAGHDGGESTFAGTAIGSAFHFDKSDEGIA